MGRPNSARDLVQIHITDGLPISARALPFADRIELRFGRAFPVALLIDGSAVARFAAAVQSGRTELEATGQGAPDE